MTDLVDQAQETAQMFTDAALARVRRPLVCDGEPEPRNCIECGNSIPAERLRAVPDTGRCVRCQVLRDGRSL
ncbi:TraR/DksA C4-type zinc finger protein [Ferrovibrio sp.]|uniref:TraR/DksA C4-type zinc finger protein n=1 Tax=Ferrovibrio sp. TaxID=1917215 RepID=UPI0035B249F5